MPLQIIRQDITKMRVDAITLVLILVLKNRLALFRT